MNSMRAPLNIWEAAERGCLAALEQFVGRGHDPNATDRGMVTPLHKAARAGHEQIVEWLLSHGASPNCRTLHNPGESGAYTPLHLAVELGHANVVKLLLMKGAKVDPRLSDGSTPLMLAAAGGRIALVQMLLDAGASVRAQDQMRHTALMHALAGNHLEVAKNLLCHGADVNHRADPFNFTPVLFAASDPNPVKLMFLLQSGADLNVIDDRGCNAVHVAVIAGAGRSRRIEFTGGQERIISQTKPADVATVVKLLLQRGVDPKKTDNQGMTPLDWARKGRVGYLIEILEPIIGKGSSLNGA